MFALLGRGVEAVDVVAGGVVEEVGFRGGDVVAKLPVGDGYADGVEAFLCVCEVVRFGVAFVVAV